MGDCTRGKKSDRLTVRVCMSIAHLVLVFLLGLQHSSYYLLCVIGKCEKIILYLFTFASLLVAACILSVSFAGLAITYHGFCLGHGQAIEIPAAQLSTNKQTRPVLK